MPHNVPADTSISVRVIAKFRQQEATITWANVGQDLRGHMAS